MLTDAVEFIRLLAQSEPGDLDNQELINQARAVMLSLSSIMEISIFSMVDTKVSSDPHHIPLPDFSEPADHYDVCVSIRDGDGEIHEIDDREGLAASEVAEALREFAAKYPAATLKNPSIAENLT